MNDSAGNSNLKTIHEWTEAGSLTPSFIFSSFFFHSVKHHAYVTSTLFLVFNEVMSFCLIHEVLTKSLPKQILILDLLDRKKNNIIWDLHISMKFSIKFKDKYISSQKKKLSSNQDIIKHKYNKVYNLFISSYVYIKQTLARKMNI